MSEPVFYPACILDGKTHYNVFIRQIQITEAEALRLGLASVKHADDGLNHALVKAARHGFAEEYHDLCWVAVPPAETVVRDTNEYAVSFDYMPDAD